MCFQVWSDISSTHFIANNGLPNIGDLTHVCPLQGKLGVPGLPGYPGRQGPKVYLHTSKMVPQMSVIPASKSSKLPSKWNSIQSFIFSFGWC